MRKRREAQHRSIKHVPGIGYCVARAYLREIKELPVQGHGVR